MAFSPLQPSFAGGEVSPRLRGRVDSDIYRIALAECLNFEVLPGGALQKAGGTWYVATLLSGGSRLVPFKTAAGLDFILELGNLTGRIYSPSGQVSLEGAGSGGGANLVPSGNFDSATGWTLNAYASIAGGRLRLSVGREYLDESKIEYELVPGTANRLFTVSAAGDYQVAWTRTGVSGVLVTFLNGAVVVAQLAAPGTVTLPAGDITVAIAATGGYLEAAYVDDLSVTATGAPATYALTPPWTTEQLAEVQWVAETGRDRMIFVHPNVAPWALTRNADGTWTAGALAFTGAPVEWAGTNWPAVVEIHAGRLWLGRGQRLWASRVGALTDFRRYTVIATGLPTDVKDANSQVTAECAIDVTVSTKAHLRWLQTQRTLLLGTDVGEHYVVSQGGAPAPGDIDVVAGSEFGSGPLQSVAAGDQALYVSADRRKPRVIGFEYQADGWVSRDLAWTADHITEPLIGDALWVRSPYPAAVFRLLDGTLAICLYDRGAQQLSWWRKGVTGGKVLSACVTDGAYGSIVWLSVERELLDQAGALTGTIVTLETFRLADDSDVVLDGMVTGVLDADLSLAGLDHLEGQEVRQVRDGVVIANTVYNGRIWYAVGTAAAGDVVHAGRPYTARAVTLPLEGGNPRGSAQASKRRWAKVRVRLNRSLALPLVNGYRPADRNPSTPMDEAEPAFTGDVEVATAGWDEDGQITIEQDQPLHTEVLALFGASQVNQL